MVFRNNGTIRQRRVEATQTCQGIRSKERVERIDPALLVQQSGARQIGNRSLVIAELSIN